MARRNEDFQEVYLHHRNGGRLLEYNEKLYKVNQKMRREKMYWVCIDRQCRAKLHTNNIDLDADHLPSEDVVIQQTNEHTCDVQIILGGLIFYADFKQILEESEEQDEFASPRAAYNKAVARLPAQFKPPTFRRAMIQVRRQRDGKTRRSRKDNQKQKSNCHQRNRISANPSLAKRKIIIIQMKQDPLSYGVGNISDSPLGKRKREESLKEPEPEPMIKQEADFKSPNLTFSEDMVDFDVDQFMEDISNYGVKSNSPLQEKPPKPVSPPKLTTQRELSEVFQGIESASRQVDDRTSSNLEQLDIDQLIEDIYNHDNLPDSPEKEKPCTLVSPEKQVPTKCNKKTKNELQEDERPNFTMTNDSNQSLFIEKKQITAPVKQSPPKQIIPVWRSPRKRVIPVRLAKEFTLEMSENPRKKQRTLPEQLVQSDPLSSETLQLNEQVPSPESYIQENSIEMPVEQSITRATLTEDPAVMSEKPDFCENTPELLPEEAKISDIIPEEVIIKEEETENEEGIKLEPYDSDELVYVSSTYIKTECDVKYKPETHENLARCDHFYVHKKNGCNLVEYNGRMYRLNIAKKTKFFWTCFVSHCKAKLHTESFDLNVHTHPKDLMIQKTLHTCGDHQELINELFTEELNHGVQQQPVYQSTSRRDHVHVHERNGGKVLEFDGRLYKRNRVREFKLNWECIRCKGKLHTYNFDLSVSQHPVSDVMINFTQHTCGGHHQELIDELIFYGEVKFVLSEGLKVHREVYDEAVSRLPQGFIPPSYRKTSFFIRRLQMQQLK